MLPVRVRLAGRCGPETTSNHANVRGARMEEEVPVCLCARWGGAEGDVPVDPKVVDLVPTDSLPDTNYLLSTQTPGTAPGPLAPLGGAPSQWRPRTSSHRHITMDNLMSIDNQLKRSWGGQG